APRSRVFPIGDPRGVKTAGPGPTSQLSISTWDYHMTCSGSVLCRARTATATVALVSVAYLVMSGTTANHAAAQSSGEARKESWLTRLWPGASLVFPSEDQAQPQY